MVSWSFHTEGEGKAFEEMFKDSDRGAAIVAAGFVENSLEYKMRHLLRDDDSNITSVRDALTEMFRAVGPLGPFASKIRMGLLLRMFGVKAYKELMTIKDIRNRFAHSLEHVTFEDQQISDWCKKLTLVEGYFQPLSEHDRLGHVPGMHFSDAPLTDLDTTRGRYIAACGIYVTTFSLGNYPIFAPVHGDDRPSWPEMSWQLAPRP